MSEVFANYTDQELLFLVKNQIERAGLERTDLYNLAKELGTRLADSIEEVEALLDEKEDFS